MLTSYFGRYQAFYMLPSQYQTMGRTFGPDLVIPTVQRQHIYHPPDQDLFYAPPNPHLLQQQPLQQHQQQPEDNSGNKDSSHGKQNKFIAQSKAKGTEHSGHGHNSSEIKFSIDRILSNECSSSAKESLVDGIKNEAEDRKSGNEEVKAEVSTDTEESVSYEWLHCTRYKPPKLQRARKKESCKKRKLGRNPRVPFTQQQVVGLERKFGRTHYLSSLDVAELSSALNLSETRVKIWFQNRRARERRNNHSKQSQGGQGLEQSDGRDANFIFAPSTSCFGSSVVLSSPDASQRSLSQLHEALQHCSAFAPLPLRHSANGT